MHEPIGAITCIYIAYVYTDIVKTVFVTVCGSSGVSAYYKYPTQCIHKQETQMSKILARKSFIL